MCCQRIQRKSSSISLSFTPNLQSGSSPLRLFSQLRLSWSTRRHMTCNHREIFECAHLKFTVQTNKRTSIDTHTLPQCSHTSVGLAQARPSKCYIISSLISEAHVGLCWWLLGWQCSLAERWLSNSASWKKGLQLLLIKSSGPMVQKKGRLLRQWTTKTEIKWLHSISESIVRYMKKNTCLCWVCTTIVFFLYGFTWDDPVN